MNDKRYRAMLVIQNEGMNPTFGMSAIHSWPDEASAELEARSLAGMLKVPYVDKDDRPKAPYITVAREGLGWLDQ